MTSGLLLLQSTLTWLHCVCYSENVLLVFCFFFLLLNVKDWSYMNFSHLKHTTDLSDLSKLIRRTSWKSLGLLFLLISCCFLWYSSRTLTAGVSCELSSVGKLEASIFRVFPIGVSTCGTAGSGTWNSCLPSTTTTEISWTPVQSAAVLLVNPPFHLSL